ncbi:MAG: extracellular solute-binding protein [Armatimonadota bacterium]
MKLEFAAAFACLTVVSFFMWKSQPNQTVQGKTPLVWTSDDNPLRKEQIDLFNRQHPSLNLQLDPNNQGLEKVIVQSLAGVGPDLIDCRDANQLAAYVKAGIAWDITEELKSKGIDVKTQTWSCMQPTAILDGRVFGVPTNCAANAIWINRKVFKESHVPLPSAPWTWTQFISLAQKMSRRDRNGRWEQIGFLFDWWNAYHFITTFGGRTFSPGGTSSALDSPQVIEAVQLMHDLVYKYRVTPSPVEESGMASAGGWGSGTINTFGSNRAAMALGGRWWLANMRSFMGLELTVVASPFSLSPACSTAGRSTLINVRSPRRKQALEFLTYLASKEYGSLINDQADGIAAFKSQSLGSLFEFNPKHPQENYNNTWRAITATAVGEEGSPYINGQIAKRIFEKQLDLVRVDAKSPADAMKDAAKEVNEEIKKKLNEDPILLRRWTAATGHAP